jgi:hypothetical protein
MVQERDDGAQEGLLLMGQVARRGGRRPYHTTLCQALHLLITKNKIKITK